MSKKERAIAPLSESGNTQAPSTKRHPRKSKRRHYVATTKKLIIIGATLFFFIVGGFLVWAASLKIPTLDNFEERTISSSTKIYDRTGEIILYDVHENIKRTAVESDDISRNAKNAIVAIEDSEFYNHNGIRIQAIIRAVIANITSAGSRVQGGSTLTQQMVKNTLLSRERTITRKVKEWILALRVEHILTKDEILTLYLNEAPYGGSIYGIEQASQSFFGKPAAELTVAESAYLAAIPNAPTYYSPYGQHREELERRKNLVLSQMKKLNFITASEYEEALSEDVVFRPQEENYAKAFHFVQWIQEYLEEEYGEERILNQGLKVITTLDWGLQQEAERIVLENALEQEELYDAENQGVVAINPKTGEILTMVGSRDYFDENIDGKFNVATAKRQPGSSFKPFIYYTAFAEGYTPETTVWDTRTQFNPNCEPTETVNDLICYSPVNYDNDYLGPISFRNALGQSRNVPAVKALYLVGIRDALRTAEAAGITSLTDPNRYGLTLVLGGGEVSLLEMTSAFGVFGNDGVRVPYTGILRIEDSRGEVLEEWIPEDEEEQVLDEQAVRQLNSVLSDNAARTPLFGTNSFMYFGESTDVAAKTGTTNSRRDGWLIGYSPEIAVGVWTGNNDNTPMEKGSSISGPTWRAIMDYALENLDLKRERFPDPDPIENFDQLPPPVRGVWQSGEPILIDKLTGLLATEFTPEEFLGEVFELDPHSILYWINKDNPRVKRDPESPADDQLPNWEASILAWLEDEENLASLGSSITIPTKEDDLHTEENQPSIEIITPKEDDTIIYDEAFTVRVDAEPGENDLFILVKVDYYLDDVYLGSSDSEPYTFSVNLEEAGLEVPNGDALLRAVVMDAVLNRTQAVVEVEVTGVPEEL